MEMNNFYCCKGSATSNLAISLVPTTLENKPKEFDFVHLTVSQWEACAGWAQDKSHTPSFILTASNEHWEVLV